MNAATVLIFGLIAFLCAYRFYAKFLSQKLFGLDTKAGETPAHTQRDDVDYCPTAKNILVGHHFSSIAGAAPIVGPAVAAIWGWLPAVMWIIFGVVFMGACHDFGALVLSMNHKGGSIAYVSQEIIGPRVRNLFLLVIFFLVWMVIAVFALVIANLFVSYPSSVLPVNFEIIVALLMGYFINRGKKGLGTASILAQLTLFLMIYLGSLYPISLKPLLGENELMGWMVFLLMYSFVASVLPVWLLLQPRDYINGHQLVVGLTLLVAGLLYLRPEIVAPATNFNAEGSPPWFPFLFITIACGAISGFHGLVSSGTTSKQVNQWRDARPVAYGSMLAEGLLALIATLAVTAGFTSQTAWHNHYANWNAANGLAAKINAFVMGSGRFISSLGIDQDISETLMAVLIISFAATSLDTACRIQRYIIGEMGQTLKIKTLENRYVGSGIAVLSAFLLMISSDGGKGGLIIWPLFGATNQMLAALTLILISTYLWRYKKKVSLHYILPTIFVLIITTIGLFMNIKLFYSKGNTFLTVLGAFLLIAQGWIVFESVALFSREKNARS